LINKSRDDYATEEVDILYLFRKAIEVIDRNENLSPRVQDELYKARLRVQRGDNFAEMLQVLSAVCHMCLKQPKPQVKALTTQIQVDQLAAQVKALTYTPTTPPPAPQQKKKQAAPQQKNTDQKKKVEKDGKPKRQPSIRKRYKFVAPWPRDKPYLSKSGNTLRQEAELHFKGFCLKCGCDNHRADSCITYPEKTTIMTLCIRCMQGFHEVCRSKRKGLDKQKMDPQVMAVQTYQLMSNLQENYMQQQQMLQQLQDQQNQATKKKQKGAVTVVTPDSDSD
jgi:hypothetical protein